MPIEIPFELRPFVDREMRSGLYESEQDLVRHALERLRLERTEALAGIQEGMADMAAGRFKPIDVAFDDIASDLRIGKDQ